MKSLKIEDLISEDTSCLILYGSQLGNAEAIAESLLDTAESQYFLNAKLLTLNSFCDIAEFAKINCPIVIVTSTTGDGEAPENADKFLRKLRRKLLKPNTLQSVRYTILGLGDTNFNNFCNCGKLIHKRLQELGATLFYDPAWADDATGLDQVVEPWTEDLWSNLEAAIEADDSGAINNNQKVKSKTKNPVKKLFTKMTGDKNKKDNLSENSSTKQTEPKENENILTLPACPKTSLSLEYNDQLETVFKVDLHKPPAPYPLIDGSPHNCAITGGRVLTAPESIKTTVELTFKLEEGFDFEPGDAIGIVCPNPFKEVEALLETLDLKDVADKSCKLAIKAGAQGKIPAHIPRESTIKNILLWYCDIRSPPKKAFIRLLAENTTDNNEKSALLEICSKQGATLFEKFIRQPSTSLLDILLKFPTCKPPIEALLEHLPRLSPRPYSISSSPLNSSNTFTIAFNIINFPTPDDDCDTEYRKYSRLGVCTGWLYNLGKKYFGSDSPANLVDTFGDLSLDSGASGDSQENIVFYKRKNHNFRLPKTLDSSVIMVGPGTGVAPFIGFIQHRHHQNLAGDKIGKLYLYFGCRRKDHDFLYKETLEELSSKNALTQLYTTFSRDTNSEDQEYLKYVQDALYKNKEEVVKALLDEGSYFYVCGDAKNMAKNVREKLIICIQEVKGLTEKEAMSKISELVSEKRYLQDVWS